MTRDILITNDDSISAKGIHCLAEIFRKYGDVTVVAPKFNQSAMGMALTMDRPLHLEHIEDIEPTDELGGVRYYTLDGTPTDCAKLGINMFIDEGRMPDIVVSGINHGSNASAAEAYSGTLGAAKEAAIYGIPSAGFSICTHDPDPDFSIVEEYAGEIMANFFDEPPVNGVFLNINFPDISPEDCRGIKMACRGRGRWIKEFERQNDPRGREQIWMVGEFINMASGDDVLDDHILNGDNYITIVPHKVDTTDYDELERLSKLWGY